MMSNLKQYLRAQSVECGAAITEVQKDAKDTMDNYANQFADFTLILNSDSQGYFDSQMQDLNLGVGEQYNMLQTTSNGLYQDYRLVRTTANDFKIVCVNLDGTIKEAPVMVNGELTGFKDEAELFYHDETTNITFNFKNYINGLKDGIVQSDIVAKICDCYRSLSNRLGLFKQLSATYYQEGTSTIRSFLDELYVGICQMGATPKGFLNFVKGVLDSVKNKYKTDNNALGLNTTDYTVMPYAWSGLIQVIDTVASMVMLAVQTVVSTVIAVVVKVLSLIISTVKETLNNLDPDWKVNSDTDNYLASVPVFQQTYGEIEIFTQFINELFGMDPDTGDITYAEYQDTYDAIWAAADAKDMMSFDFLWYHFNIWPVKTSDHYTWCVECYMNLYGMNIPVGNTAQPVGYRDYWGRSTVNNIAIWPWNNYRTNFFNYLNNDKDTILSPAAGLSYADSTIWSTEKLTACAFTNALYMSGVLAYMDSNESSQITRATIEGASDNFFANPSTASIIDYICALLTTVYDGDTDPEDIINVAVLKVLRLRPDLFLNMFRETTNFLGYKSGSDAELRSVLPIILMVQTQPIISSHDYFAYPPRFGSAARSGMILATVATVAIGIAATVAIVVAKIKIQKYMTKQYAKVQQAQTSMAEATTDAERDAAYKDFKKARKKYNLIAGFTGQAKLSAVNGWEVSSDPTDEETYDQGNDPYLASETTTSGTYNADTIQSLIMRLISGN